MREEHKEEPLSFLEVWEGFGGAVEVLGGDGAGVDVEGLDCWGGLLTVELTPPAWVILTGASLAPGLVVVADWRYWLV